MTINKSNFIKKHYSLFPFFIFTSFYPYSQTQKDWYLIGDNFSNPGLNFQHGNTAFSFNLTTRVAWFVKDNFEVGAEVVAGVSIYSITLPLGKKILKAQCTAKTPDSERDKIFISTSSLIYR
jgi:hypothetical protein